MVDTIWCRLLTVRTDVLQVTCLKNLSMKLKFGLEIHCTIHTGLNKCREIGILLAAVYSFIHMRSFIFITLFLSLYSVVLWVFISIFMF